MSSRPSPLAHSLLVDASKDRALAALVVAQIALDGLPQELQAGDMLLTRGDINPLKNLLGEKEQYGAVVFALGLSM